MPTRTEKKFGQASGISWGSPTLLVSSSATNRRNLVVNISAKTSASVGLATFTSAPVAAGYASYGSISSADGGTAILASTNAIAINKAMNKFVALGSAAQITGTISYANGNLSTTTLASSAIDLAQWSGSAGLDLGSGAYNPNDSWTIPAVFIDDYTVLTYSAETMINTTTEDRLVVIAIDSTGALTKSLNYYRPADGASSTTGQYRGVYALQNAYGFALDGEVTVSNVTAGAVGLGIRVFTGASLSSSGTPALAGEVWWDLDGTLNKTSGRLQHYFSVIDYNPKYGVFAISTPTTTGLWSGVTATGGTGDFATNLPTLPNTAAPAGFRIVANDGTNAASRKFMDGTTTYPSAPSGVSIQAESNNQPPVVSLKFSPNGEYLAAQYGLGHIAIYQRQSNGTWSHVNTTNAGATGSAIAPSGPDGMAWGADNSAVFTSQSGQTSTRSIYVFNGAPGNIPINGYESFNNYYSSYAGFPGMIGYEGAIDNNTVTAAGVPSAWTHSASNVGIGLAGSVIDGSGKTMVVGVSSENVALGTAAYGIAGLEANVKVAIGTAGTFVAQPGYVNSILSGTKIASGETIQISNIVLEAGESLYISSSKDKALDAVAYGIEIS